MVLWVLAALILAAALAPWFYQAGMSLAEMALNQHLPEPLEWLGFACGRSKFGRFFSRALMFSAVVFLPCLWRRIRRIRAKTGQLAEPASLVVWQSALLQLILGCAIAGGMLWALGVTLEALGVYQATSRRLEIGVFGRKVLMFAIIAPLVEEWMFRGVLLGLWLKFARPLTACVGTSLVFAFVHFLDPPVGSVVANPASLLAGFRLLGQIFLHFTNPQFFITDFASLFVVGMILAVARVRTGALWFSIGLHAGWIIAFKSFSLLYRQVPAHPLHPWGVGDSLRSGLLPLFGLGLTAAICQFVWWRFKAPLGGGLTPHNGDCENLQNAGTAEDFSAFVDGRSGGEHVVDENHPGHGFFEAAAADGSEGKGPAKVCLALGASERGLVLGRPSPP